MVHSVYFSLSLQRFQGIFELIFYNLLRTFYNVQVLQLNDIDFHKPISRLLIIAPCERWLIFLRRQLITRLRLRGVQKIVRPDVPLSI